MKKGLLGKFKASKKKKSDDVGDAALEALEALDEKNSTKKSIVESL